MANMCSVVNCDSKPGVILHKYPLYDEELFKTWVMRTHSPRLPAPENLRAYKKYFVCGKHFLDDCLLPGGQKLKQFAIPTIDCPGYFGEATIEASYLASYLKRKNTPKPKDTVAIDVDHCYTGLPQEPIENISAISQSSSKLQHKKFTTSPKRLLNTILIDPNCDGFQPQDDVPLAKLFKQIIRPAPLSSLKNINAPLDPLLPSILINPDNLQGPRTIIKPPATTPYPSIIKDVPEEDGQPKKVLKSILKPTSKYNINENCNTLTATPPPQTTLVIDLDKDELRPETGVPPGIIFLDLDNNLINNNETNYVSNTKTAETVTKTNRKEKQQVLLDLDIENFIMTDTSNTEHALDALSLGDQNAPIYDLTGDDDPVPPAPVNKIKGSIRKLGKYYPPRERSLPLETKENTRKPERTTPTILVHNKKTLKKIGIYSYTRDLKPLDCSSSFKPRDTPPPPVVEVEIPQIPESPPEINRIDDKQLILDRIKAKKLLINKKRQDAETSSLTLLKPTSISFVPLDGSYKTTVFVHSVRDNNKTNNNQTVN